MNVAKLLNLAALLRQNAADEKGMKFDLAFVNKRTSDVDILYEMGRNCGTAGCAIGLAAVSPEFPEIAPYSGRAVKLNGERVEWDIAAMQVFDLSRTEVLHLFMECSYPLAERRGAVGELAVANRIERFVFENT